MTAAEQPTPLLPCPFCGSRAVFGEITDPEDKGNFGGHFITCTGCIATTDLRFASGDDPEPLLAEAWNSRVAAERIAEAVEPRADRSALLEECAEAAHEAWLAEKRRRLGAVTTWPNERGFEQLVPWAVLSEDVREFDRIVVGAIMGVLDARGLTVSAPTPPPGDAGNPAPARRPFETGPGGLWKDERGIWREPGEGIRGGGA